MKRRVLVTRPEPGAARTAKRLAAAGYDPVVLPLTRIVPLAFDFPEDEFDAMILTSAQALRAASGTDFTTITDLPVFAIGETTAQAARRTGFNNVKTAGGSVESVCRLITSSVRPGAGMLYLCGKVRRPDLEAQLQRSGFAITAVETYDAPPVDYDPAEMDKRLGDGPIDAVTLLSLQAAEIFSELGRNKALRDRVKDALLICFSERIAAGVSGTGLEVAVTSDANEDALFRLLAERLPI